MTSLKNIKVVKKRNIFQKLIPSVMQSSAQSEMMKKHKKKKGSKQNKEKYKKKMMRIYKLTPAEYDQAKKSALQAEQDWASFKKEQVLKIFEPKNVYVSRSAKSDVKHPKLARATRVQMKDGKTVEVEFGRLKEFYLFSLAPDKTFVDVKSQTKQENKLKALRDAQKERFGNKPGKSQAEYDELKSVYDANPVVPRKPIIVDEHKTDPPSPDEIRPDPPDDEKYNANTTDEKHGLFLESWYSLSISQSRMEKEGMTYWIPKSGAADEEFDDDPEGKFTVTAEKLIEALESKEKVKDSGVVEPKKEAGPRVLVEPLSMIHERYQKTCSRQIVYLNTLKGTIEFGGKAAPEKAGIKSQEKTNKTLSINEEPTTDGHNQITFAPTITAFVFKGNRLKRQYCGLNLVEKYEEERKDYTREAGEDTSGGI